MKSYTDAALAAYADGTAMSIGAIEIHCDPPFFAAGGDGKLSMVASDGVTRDFIGLGANALVEVGGGALGGAAQNITLTLSGVDPDVIAAVNTAAVRGSPVVVWELTFDGSGQTLLDAHIFARGSADRLPRSEQPGGTASIKVMVETAANGLGRRGSRMRTDADQRMIKANDGACKHVSYAGEKTLYWGGKRSSAGSSLSSGRG
ncbi:hypothetical protein ACWGM0_17915 [Sphingomonas bisphenolicum]